MTTTPGSLSRNRDKHYCRVCTTTVDRTPGPTLSAHTAYVLHMRHVHGADPETNVRCDKYCLGHEQADEKQHGVKLYGPGASRLSRLVPLIRTYEELFPEETP